MQTSLITRLKAHCFDVSLEQAWQLFKHKAQHEGLRPAVRFSAATLPSYYSGDIVEIDADRYGTCTLNISLPALSGNSATMPRTMYKEALHALFTLSDKAPIDFFNIFNNRYFRLYCQSEQKYQLSAQIEEASFDWNQGKLSITEMLVSLTGLTEGIEALPKEHLIQYIGLLGSCLATPLSLKAMLEAYFQTPFDIESTPLEYLPLTPCSWTQIGKKGQNKQLGLGALLGKTTPMIGQKLKVIIFPQSYVHYQEIQNNQKLIQALNFMVRTFIGVNVKFILCMKISNHYLPRVQISANGASFGRLGQSIWMSHHLNDALDRQFVEMPLIENEVRK